ncbi:DUF3710 domain-containing protein [Rhodoluna sp.]|uniref:DUF3710 domain-containing protein n=1 Tax=Rhodoluna sp. TaxID=1969481 RepID=UPI0025E0FB07|nr:DUF3710 domain-containing protein [Rhodoluna sp.]
MSNDLYAATKSAPADRRSGGPFDISEVSDVSPYIDFGALRVAAREDMQMRLEVEEATQRLIAVSLDWQGSTLQLQAFAAPRTDGVWHEVRGQMKDSILAQGGEVEERVGSLGPELLAKIPLLDEHGNKSGFRLARFIGVDGPKWFLRGVVGGAALTDARAGADIDDLFRSVIVVRGDVPMPPKDLLTLTLPGGTVAPPRSI